MPNIVTKYFLEILNNLIDSKVHLYHSHVNGEIHRYAHNFYNEKVKDNKNFIMCKMKDYVFGKQKNF